MSELRILGISGSLREGSYNRALLRAAAGLLPDGSRLETCEIREIPPFDQDLEASGDPPAVVELKARIRESHALLVVTPEYNWGVPGVLKNAIDWASRPAATSVLKQKPVALAGASTGPWGTTRAQLQLRQAFVYTDSLALPQPNLFVPLAKEKFDEGGALVHGATREQLRALLAALAAWTRRVAPLP